MRFGTGAEPSQGHSAAATARRYWLKVTTLLFNHFSNCNLGNTWENVADTGAATLDFVSIGFLVGGGVGSPMAGTTSSSGVRKTFGMR